MDDQRRGIPIGEPDQRSHFEPFHLVQTVQEGQIRSAGFGLYVVTRMRETFPLFTPFLYDLPLLFRGSIYARFPAHVASRLEALILPN